MKLCYTRSALEDLKQIADYLDPRSPDGARKVRRRIKLLIEQRPFHLLPGKRTEDPAIRRLVATPYPSLIFYEVAKRDIIIHAIRHGARDSLTPQGEPRS